MPTAGCDDAKQLCHPPLTASFLLDEAVMRLIWIVLVLVASSVKVTADEWWAWSMIDYYRKPPWTAGVFLFNRADSDDGSIVQLVSPRLKYAAMDWLDIGTGLSLLRIENPVTHLAYGQLRPELELQPHFDLTRHLRLEMRHRMEWRMNEGQSFTTNRSRHRLQLSWTLPRPIGPLTRLYVNNEWLFDTHRSQWTENRLVPLGLTFRLGAHTDLDLFYMINSTRNHAAWKSESVFGTYLRVRF